MDVVIEEPDWKILAGMGSGAEAGLQAAGIDDFDGAVKACAAVEQSLDGASGAEYKLDDLICFLCLSQHKEAVANPELPAPARPVSIEEDLDLDLLLRRCIQAPPLVDFDNPSEAEAQAPSPAPEQGVVLPLNHRRWRAHTLLPQPLAQPTWRPLVSFEFPLARVEGDMLPWLPIASAISLVQCCRSLRGGGLCLPGLISDGCVRAADSVADAMFHPARVAALDKLGFKRSTMMRTVACAWD